MRISDWSSDVCSSDLHFAFFALRLAAADRAVVREDIGLAVLRPLLLYDLDHLGNDVAGALNDDVVALADVLARDLVLVVQGGARDHHAADGDRLQVGDRRQRAGAPDLDGDLLPDGLRLPGRELVCDGPARGAADRSAEHTSE